MGANKVSALRAAIHETTPFHLKSIKDEGKIESLRARVETVVEKAQNLKVKSDADAKVSTPSRIGQIGEHFGPVGGWVTTLGGQIAGLITGWPESSIGTKVLQFFTIGGSVTTGAITAVVYWRYFRQEDIANLRKGKVEQLTDTQNTLNFLLSSQEMAETCLNPSSDRNLKDQFENFRAKMLHGLKDEHVPTGLCAAWIRIGIILKKIENGKASDEDLAAAIREDILPHIGHYTSVHNTRLGAFRKKASDDRKKAHAEGVGGVDARLLVDAHSSPANLSAVKPGEAEQVSEDLKVRLKALLAESGELKDKQEEKVDSAEDSIFKKIHTHYAPVGTWIVTIGGEVAIIIDDWNKSTPGTKTIEFATLAASLVTGVITGIVYYRHFRDDDLAKLKKEISGDSEAIEQSARFMKASHELGELCKNPDTPIETLHKKYKSLEAIMVHGLKQGIVPSGLCAAWIEAGDKIASIKQQANEVPMSFSSSSSSRVHVGKRGIESNEDVVPLGDHFEYELEIEEDRVPEPASSLRHELREYTHENLLPHIKRHMKHFERVLAPFDKPEPSGWRTYRPFSWCFGTEPPKAEEAKEEEVSQIDELEIEMQERQQQADAPAPTGWRTYWPFRNFYGNGAAAPDVDSMA